MFRRFKFSYLSIAFAVAVLVISGGQTMAQVVGIVAVVNDNIISAYDLEQRMRIIISSARMPDNAETRRRLRGQALRALIDDQLRLQEAKRRNMSVSKDDMARARNRIEKQNKLKVGGFSAFVLSQGLDEDAVLAQMKAELAWNKLIDRRLKRRIRVSDDEVDETYTRLLKSEGLRERQLGEIYLPVTRAGDLADIERTAKRLVGQLRGGASFTAIARQFSQGPGANKGGVIGWILEGQLGAKIETALANVTVGKYSDPIRTVEGIYIYFVRNERRVGASDPLAAEITLKQLALSLAKQAPQSEVDRQLVIARKFAGMVQGCDDIDRAAKELGASGAGSLGKLRVGDLPPRFRSAVANLPIGRPSTPLRTDQGLHVLIVCDRTEAKAYRPNREAVVTGLGQQRLGMMARRLLRDLRRDANIDVR